MKPWIRDLVSIVVLFACTGLALLCGWWYSEHADAQRSRIMLELHELRQEVNALHWQMKEIRRKINGDQPEYVGQEDR